MMLYLSFISDKDLEQAVSSLLFSCYSHNSLKNKELKNKVYACGVMFGDNINESLSGHFANNLQVGGTLNNNFTTGVKTIFDEVLPQDSAKAYKDNIQCIESLKIASLKSNSKP